MPCHFQKLRAGGLFASFVYTHRVPAWRSGMGKSVKCRQFTQSFCFGFKSQIKWRGSWRVDSNYQTISPVSSKQNLISISFPAPLQLPVLYFKTHLASRFATMPSLTCTPSDYCRFHKIQSLEFGQKGLMIVSLSSYTALRSSEANI